MYVIVLMLDFLTLTNLLCSILMHAHSIIIIVLSSVLIGFTGRHVHSVHEGDPSITFEVAVLYGVIREPVFIQVFIPQSASEGRT